MTTMTGSRPDPETAGEVAVQAVSVRKAYGDRTVLADLDLEIRRGEFVALLGASGSGKTTFLRALAGLEDRSTVARCWCPSGARWCSRTRAWSRRSGLPTTSSSVSAERDRSARRGSARWQRSGWRNASRAWPSTLSGGEAQRVALARALVREPRLLLLDEPFAALDALTRMRMQALVAQLCRKHGPAVLLVTHDVDEAILLADRVLVLREGRVASEVVVPFPRPRRRGVPGFGDLRRALLGDLGVVEAIGADG